MKNFERRRKTKNQAAPEDPKPESEKAATSLVEAKRRIAAETGRFYNALMDVYLEVKTPKDRQQQTDALINGLPSPMQELYREGLKRLQEELNKNHALLEQHQGDVVRYLLGTVMTAADMSSEAMEEVFQQIDSAKFIESSSGIAIVEMKPDFFKFLSGGDIGDAAHFGGEPSFIMIPSLTLENDNGQVKGNKTVRHEFHHLIWGFLERRGGYLREVKESSPEQTQAFRRFRNEVAAYIITDMDVVEVSPEKLIYTEESEALKVATDARDFASTCIEVARQKGIDPQNFLYACMSSRNFVELKDTFATLTPLEKADQQSIAGLYFAFRNGASGEAIAELLERKHLVIPANLVEEYGLSVMLSASIAMREIFLEVELLKSFAEILKIDAIDDWGLVEKAMRGKLPLPKETVDVILELSKSSSNDRLIYNIPLDKSGEEFLKSIISFWRVIDGSIITAYKKIIDSSPVMRETFNKIRAEIINEGAKAYRDESKSSRKARKTIESEIQRRTRLLMEL